VPVFNAFLTTIKTITTGYLNLNYVEIGPYFKIFSEDDIDGFRLRLGIKTGDSLSTRFTLGVYSAYGFRDKTYKYGGNFDYILKKYPRQKIGLYYQNDLDVGATDISGLLKTIFYRVFTAGKISPKTDHVGGIQRVL